jgi:hypothetical protein
MSDFFIAFVVILELCNRAVCTALLVQKPTDVPIQSPAYMHWNRRNLLVSSPFYGDVSTKG